MFLIFGTVDPPSYSHWSTVAKVKMTWNKQKSQDKLVLPGVV